MPGKTVGLLISNSEKEANLKKYQEAKEWRTLHPQTSPGAARPFWDWRQKDGEIITPCKDQKGHHACVPFAMVAAMESTILMRKDVREKVGTTDLSEADLMFWEKDSMLKKKRSETGWDFATLMERSAKEGVCLESCYPWKDKVELENPCANRDRLSVRMSWDKTNDPDYAKSWLMGIGPLVTGMEVFADLDNYSSSTRVYHHSKEKILVYGPDGPTYMIDSSPDDHAVCIIGFNDIEEGGYWIVKNSWGPDWGDNGCFKIAYEECNIGTKYGFYAPRIGEEELKRISKDATWIGGSHK